MRVPAHRAVATADSVSALWNRAMAEGSFTFFLPSRRECHLIRNKLYAYRARERRAALAHTGIEWCSLDPYKPSFGPLAQYTGLIPHNVPADYWFFTISRDDLVQITLTVKETEATG